MLRIISEFYSVRSRLTGQHVAADGGYTQDIDSMVTPIRAEAAERVLNELSNKEDHYVVRWTMVEITK